MDVTNKPLPESPADSSPAPLGELVVQNGRLSGTRRALTAPLTLIGRSAGCEIRLNVEGVQPLHCALVSGTAGLFVRDFQQSGATRVNGQAVAASALHDGDLLAIGPFQFRVLLPARGAMREPEALEREKEALRIQAAAVAAQQAALTEEEIRLQQRGVALEQQEKQLSAHLENKRQLLLALRDETRQAHATLLNERATYEQRVAEVLVNLEQSRREVNNNFHQAKTERQRLQNLQRRLKQRWHRHWAAEREAMRRRESELVGQRSKLEKECQRLEHQKASLAQSQLRLNGETEVGRRELRAEWDKLRQEKGHLQERWQSLEQREGHLREAQQRFTTEQQRCEATRLNLNQEIQGLENRAHNFRRKLRDQGQEVVRLEATIRNLQQAQTGNTRSPSVPVEQVSLPAKGAIAESPVDDIGQREWQMRQLEQDLQSRTAALETLADELADQRLQLAEESARLDQVQQSWQSEHNAVAEELEGLGRRLQDREQELLAREQSLEAAERDPRHRPVPRAA